MRLGVKPHIFFLRLLAAFVVTLVVWMPVAPHYTGMLAAVTRVALNLTERVSGQAPSQMFVRETAEGRPAIYYRHGRLPQLESGIPAEWVQANIVLLIPLMMAVPAVSWSQRFKRLGLALLLAVGLQVLDVIVTVKALYASYPPAGFGNLSRRVYQFGDAFAQAFDTQLFPFAIWAGIHFRQLLGRPPRTETSASNPSESRAVRRAQARKPRS